MAGFGLGLGAFTQGFANGVGLGQRWDQVRRQNSDRDAIDKVNTEAKSAFDADVAAGSTTPDKWNDYFSTNVLPKLSQTYAQQGNMEGARYAQQWGESEAAKKGVSAFGRLLTAGNFDEAGKAFADLGSAKGYLPGGFVYSGSEAVAGPNGQQGLKIMWRSPDGKAYSQQFGSIDELKQMAAGALNPEAVAKLHVDQMGWGAEDSRKLGLYRRQKEIDAQYGLSGPNALQGQARERQRVAEEMGLKPGTPVYQAYVLTGKMPREDTQPLTATDKKAILEADEAVAANQNAVSNLDRATELSGKSLEGWGAGTRAAIANNVPVVGRLFASPEEAKATAELSNTVTSNALEQLKAIFGGAPTEGERAILLQIQGAAEQPKAVREAIYARAKEMAQRRLEFNRQRAESLRGQTYYQSGGAPTQGVQQAPDQGQGARPQQGGGAPRPSLSPGAVFNGFRYLGGDPNSQQSWERAQ